MAGTGVEALFMACTKDALCRQTEADAKELTRGGRVPSPVAITATMGPGSRSKEGPKCCT